MSQRCLKYSCTVKVFSDLTSWKAKWKIIQLFDEAGTIHALPCTSCGLCLADGSPGSLGDTPPPLSYYKRL